MFNGCKNRLRNKLSLSDDAWDKFGDGFLDDY